MSDGILSTNSSQAEPAPRFLTERLRIFTNYWIFPTIFLSNTLLRALLAYIGDYFDLFVVELPSIGTLGLFLIYILFIMRFVFRYVRNLFGLHDTTRSPLRALFSNHEAFKNYQQKVRSRLFGNEGQFILGWTLFSAVLYLRIELVSGTFGKPYGTVESPIGMLDYSFGYIFYVFVAIILGDIAWIFLGILRSIRALGYADGLSIVEYVTTLTSSKAGEGREAGGLDLQSTFFSYEQFHRQLKVVGRFCLTCA